MGKGAVLRNAIENDSVQSMIFWGPPGVGKTTLALLIAELTAADFYMLSAISSGVKDIREVIEKARKSERQSLLFIDEIHRFSKAQQDSLLGAVEQGVVTLIGATTENPSFEVISPLLSRCQVYVLKSLSRQQLEQILATAVAYLEEHLHCIIKLEDTEALLRISGGDARKLLNAVELVTAMTPPQDGIITVTRERVVKVIQQNIAVYDKKGEAHYDIISAFIKSIRGSDPNAAVYWMARMLIAGEDPLFIARRMVILASEDIGNANPNALLLANNCFQAVHETGMPEARIPLAQTAIYLASSPKSNAAIMAIDTAYALVKQTGDLPVPLHIRNAPTNLMKELGYNKGYRYAHDYENHFVEQEFMPDGLHGAKVYEPQDNPRENELRRYLRNCWKDKYKYVLLLLLAMTFFFSPLKAQNHHFSQFNTAPVSLNPALTGAFEGICRAALNQRTQWLSVTAPYLTFAGSIDGALYKSSRRQELLAIGGSFLSFKAGDVGYTSLNAKAAVSYVKSLGRKSRHKVGIGGYAGFFNNFLDFSAARWDSQYQHYHYSAANSSGEAFETEKQYYLDLGAGLFWSFTPDKNNTFRLGAAAEHVNCPREAFGTTAQTLPVRFTAHFLSRIGLTRELALEPMAYASWQRTFQEYTFGANVEYFKRKNNYTTLFSLGGGLLYRWNDALIANVFFNCYNVRVGVSYDVNVSAFRKATHLRGGLELSLVYILKKNAGNRLNKELCPYELM